MNPAKRWYVERVYKELIRHQERIVWLSADRPVWQCGTPVDSYTRQSLLQSSVELVATISKQLNPLRDPRNVR